MNDNKDERWAFVLRHYKPGKFDTRRAMRRFRDSHGPDRHAAIVKWRYIASVAALVAILLTAGLYLHHGTASDAKWRMLAAADRNVTYMLPDSTVVTMAPRSRLSFLYDNHGRKVKMSGKIYFEVKHDAKRPFRIDGDNSVVEILGTRFQMVDVGGMASLYVVSGKVRYSAKSNGKNVILTHGMFATIGRGAVAPEVDESGDANTMAWATGKFVFRATPISDVLRTLSEYYHIDFTANDDTKRLTGEFSTDDMAGTVSMIETVLNVKITSKNNNN